MVFGVRAKVVQTHRHLLYTQALLLWPLESFSWSFP